MASMRTNGAFHITEREKARARLVVLALVGLVCPPLAGARSPAIWVLYLFLAVIYSMWTLRLTRRFVADQRVGYLLCATDGAILLPLLAWSSSAAMRTVLVLFWAGGVWASWAARRFASRSAAWRTGSLRWPEERMAESPIEDGPGEALLMRALAVRLHLLSSTNTRFALVLLRVIRYDEIATFSGTDGARRVLSAVGHRGLRLLGPDAQSFLLEGGRVAFVFTTDTDFADQDRAYGDRSIGWIDPYDVESLAMSLGRRACEHLVDGQKVECVMGWASAPADGMTAEDLMYAAESGAESTAAYRRVAGSTVRVPDRSRVAAG
jgi:hypothetical protein